MSPNMTMMVFIMLTYTMKIMVKKEYKTMFMYKKYKLKMKNMKW